MGNFTTEAAGQLASLVTQLSRVLQERGINPDSLFQEIIKGDGFVDKVGDQLAPICIRRDQVGEEYVIIFPEIKMTFDDGWEWLEANQIIPVPAHKVTRIVYAWDHPGIRFIDYSRGRATVWGQHDREYFSAKARPCFGPDPDWSFGNVPADQFFSSTDAILVYREAPEED